MDFLAILIAAVPVTLGVTVASFAVGAVLALVLTGARRSRWVVARWLSKTVVEVLRGIPPIVILFIIFFGIGRGVLRMEPLEAAVIGLGLVSAAHLSEVYRGSLLAIPRGQFEAADALGLGRTTTSSRIIGPQAFRVALPGMVTWAISLLKDSSLVSTIGVAEIMLVTNQYARSSGDGLTPFILGAAVYIAIGTPLAIWSRWLEQRFAVARKGA